MARGKKARAAEEDSTATADGPTTADSTGTADGGDTASSGFENIVSGATEVTAEFAYQFAAPDRSEVHITAGDGDATGDNDADGLSDAAEATYGTSTSTYDTDADGIADGVEVQIGTDPLDKLGDADNDGVPDATEIGQGMNPFDADTDHDGLGDAAEYDRYPLLAIVPTPNSTESDWDGDGISNETEATYGQNVSIPEADIPEFKAMTDLNYEVRSQLITDPMQQAILASDLQRELTPEQEDAFYNEVFERGIATSDVMTQYSLASQLNAIDGTPIPADLEASYEQANADLLVALTERDLDAWISYNDARGVTLDAAATDAFVNATPSQLMADVRTIADLGFDLGTLGDTKLGTSIVATAPEVAEQLGLSTTTDAGSGSGLTSSTALDGTLDRMDDGASASEVNVTGTTGTTTSSPTDAGEGSAPASDPATATPTAPAAPTLTEIADAVGQIADDIAGQVGETGDAGDGSAAGLDTGTTAGDQLGTRFDVDEDALLGGEVSGYGTTTTGTTDDGRTYTETDLGEAGFKREYDDTGTIQFFNTDGTAKGGELDPHTDAGTETDPYAGTTDDDGDVTGEGDDDETDEVVDDGTSDEATAYVNPDADVVGIPMELSPLVVQIATTGVDPTTTDPSGPYVDDSVAPIVVSSEVAAVGLAVPMHPGVSDGNPDADLEIMATAPIAFDPEGPDVISPDDPVLGGTGEDINVGDFTPRPSAALLEPGGMDDGLDPDLLG